MPDSRHLFLVVVCIALHHVAEVSLQDTLFSYARYIAHLLSKPATHRYLRRVIQAACTGASRPRVPKLL